MKRLLMAAAALSFLAGPALAQDAGAIAAIGGTVGGKCGTSASIPVNLGSLIDTQGFLSVADRALDFGEMWCNAPADLTMEIAALQGDTPVGGDTSSFVNRLDMIISGGVMDAYFGGASLRTGPGGASALASGTTGFAFSTGAGAAANLAVELPAGTVGNDRPVAGDYSGSIIFTASIS